MKQRLASPPADHGHARSACPVACVLDILGDKWTLLVLRDLLLGKRRYNEFLDSPEGIPTNILAERLRRLQSNGLVRKQRYLEHPPRSEYLLTDKGRDLGPVLREMIHWADKHIPETATVPKQVLQAL